MSGCKACGESVVHALNLCKACLDKKRANDRATSIAANGGSAPVRPAHINAGLKVCSVCKVRAASMKGMCSICYVRAGAAKKAARRKAAKELLKGEQS